MKILNVTPEIGFAIKKLRTQYNKTAKEISELESVNKTRSYFSKLEKGDVKKIDIDLFISILNAITDTDSGLSIFLDSIIDDFDALDCTNKITFMNLDDVIYHLPIDNKFLEYINKTIKDNNLTTLQICNKINQNEEINYLPKDIYNDLPTNIWIAILDEYENSVIKLHYTSDNIDNILNNSIKSSNYITLLGLLFAIFQLIGIEPNNAKTNAVKLLNDFGMGNSRSKHRKSKTIDLDENFAGLEPTTVETYQSIITHMKILLVIKKEYASKKLDILDANLTSDLGFTFAFMTSDISSILNYSKDRKQQFLFDLKDLINKYSQPEQQTLDLYMDEQSE